MATAQLNVRPLTTNEQAASGYTHEATIKAIDDLTETTNNTDMVLNLFKTQAGDVMEKAALHFSPAFQDASDTAFNSTTFDFGDEDDTDRFFSGVEGNVNGTEVIDSFENTAYGPYTSAKQILATVHSMSGKALSDLDLGRAIILFKLNRGAVALEAGAA